MIETPDQQCIQFAQGHFALIPRQVAVAAGLSQDQIDYRLKTGALRRVHPTVYAIGGSPSTWHQELLAACYWSKDGLASHRSAAALWELPSFGPLGGVDITVTRCHLPPRSGLRVHHTNRLLPRDRAERLGIPVTGIERTLLDLGACCYERRVAIAVDSALRRGLTSSVELDAYLGLVAKRGRRGCRLLRRIVQVRMQVRSAPESPLETMFFQTMVQSGLPLPELQHEVWDRGAFVGRVDFAWPEQKVALEMDGYEFHSGKEYWERDRSRRNALTSLGWRVLHGTWSDAEKAPARLLNRVAKALDLAA